MKESLDFRFKVKVYPLTEEDLRKWFRIAPDEPLPQMLRNLLTERPPSLKLPNHHAPI